MKVLVATGIFPPQIGGPATYSKLIYDELPKRGIDVEISSFGDYIKKPRLVRHFFYFLELLKKAEGVDLVYAQDPVSVGLPALLASQIRGKKMVLKVVGDYAWEQGCQRWGVTDSLDEFAKHRKKYAWQVRVLKRIQTYVAMGASRIITPSKYLKSILVDWGVDPLDISVVYNGFHMAPVKETPSVLRKSLGLSGKVIVTVGRLVPWKGIKEIIEIMPSVRAVHPDARLVVVGDGPLEGELKKRMKELSLGDAVTFMGRMDQVSLFKLVKAADVFVLNTAYEGFSHQILETMALGTPVITTAVGGNVEIIRNNDNGILVPLGADLELRAAIIGLLGDEKVASKLARKAKKDVSGFSDEAMLLRLSAELRKI